MRWRLAPSPRLGSALSSIPGLSSNPGKLTDTPPALQNAKVLHVVKEAAIDELMVNNREEPVREQVSALPGQRALAA